MIHMIRFTSFFGQIINKPLSMNYVHKIFTKIQDQIEKVRENMYDRMQIVKGSHNYQYYEYQLNTIKEKLEGAWIVQIGKKK